MKDDSLGNLFNPFFLSEEMVDFKPVRIIDYEKKRGIISSWISEMKSGKISNSKEEEVKQRFLFEIFGNVLGYNPRDPNEWNLKPEMKSYVDATKADAGLGVFELLDSSKKSKVFAVIEIKDFNTDLDKEKKGQRSAVKQAFDYSMSTGANWVIVSNFKEIRLYQSTYVGRYEVFNFQDLDNEDLLLKFFYLLEKTGLIHSRRSRLEQLLERNEFYSARSRPKKGREEHIVDQLYKSLDQFDELGFIDAETICNLSPFSVVKDHVWHTHRYTLFTLNSEIYRLLINIEFENGSVVLTRAYQNEITKKKVKDAVRKLNFVFRKLNYSLIYRINAVRDFREIERNRKKPGHFGFSILHEFHFDDPKEGVSKNIILNSTQICNCIVCKFRSLDFKNVLLDLKSYDPEEVSLEIAYGHYLAGTNNFIESYNIYKKIAKESEYKPKERVKFFLAHYNIQVHHNLVESKNEVLVSKIRDHISDIDLEEILWIKLDGIKKDVRDVLREIRDRKLFHDIEEDIEEVISDLLKAKDHYDKGGTYLSIGNYTEKLEFLLNKVSRYVNGNFLIADAFRTYQNLVFKIFSGLLISYQLKKYFYRLNFFGSSLLLEVIHSINASRLQDLLKPVSSIQVERTELSELLLRLKSFFESFVNSGMFGVHQEDIMKEYLMNYKFKEKCSRIFTNYFIILSKIDFDDEKWDKGLANCVINFLKVEEFLYWYNLDKIGLFLEKKGNLWTSQQIIEIIIFTNSRNISSTNKYQKLLINSCNALNKFYPDVRINQSNIVQIAIANGLSETGKADYSYLIHLWKVVSDDNRKFIKNIVDSYLDSSFDGNLYDKIIRNGVYDYNYKDYFEKYISYINKGKGKGFRGVKENIPEYDDFLFENFALLVYILRIPFNDLRIKKLTNLSKYEEWLINPYQFDYQEFDPEWLLSTTNLFFLEELAQIKYIKEPLSKHLSRNFNNKLSDMYFKYFEKL